MRVKRKIFFGSFLLFAAMSGALFSLQKVQAAADVHFSQAILPVRFVYLDGKGKIEKIWSNVGDSDDLYAVKFFEKKTGKEIITKKEIMDSYESFILRSDLSVDKDEKNIFKKGKTGGDLMVNFIKDNNNLREVRTFS